MNGSRFSHVVIAGVAVILAGCATKPPAVMPAPVTAAAPTAGPNPSEADRAREAAAAAASAAQREAERVRAALEARVFFDLDQVELRPEARGILDDKVRVLRDAPSVRLRIEGHADERGSTEYNLALGARRASSVLSYLTGFGLAGSRFEVMTLGEERPLATGGHEGAWEQNRRAEFVITAGAP